MKYKRIIIISLFINVLFLVSCSDKVEKESSWEKGFKQHEVIMNGKHISFILPENYIHTDMSDIRTREEASGVDFLTLKTFYSTQNNKNKFITAIFPTEYNESSIDLYMKSYFYYWIVQDMVPFFEKKYDKNNHVYYLVMTAKIESIPQTEQKYIHSEFLYITIFGEGYYLCGLSSYDPIDSFSYEEKRKIIESVKIEEIK
ncbi:MAG TPA: hypothetical protein PLF32_02160 [Bacteroidales bacterium]|nr:hypothetical protein [Bacteroidales bacterium]HOR81444.1 hypothetical protein [Bacteroidales bacterium]HPJ90619.1 hypothetical protein [Bacteroidales bacterium]